MRTRAAHLFLLLASVAVAASAGPTDGNFTTSDGIRLHYVTAGKGDPIVLVPGWLNSTAIWGDQISRLATSYRVVALDPRSQGRSERTAEGLNPERRSRDIAELLAHLELPPVILGGFSLGALEVMAYVDQFGSDRLRGVVLVDQSIGHDLTLEDVAGFTGFVRAFNGDPAKTIDMFLPVAFKKPQPPAWLARVRDDALSTPPGIAVALLTAYLGRDWRPALSKIDRPLLYTITPASPGVLGKASLLEQAEMLKAKVESTRIEVFPEAGHALFADAPDRFHEVVTTFAADCFAD